MGHRIDAFQKISDLFRANQYRHSGLPRLLDFADLFRASPKTWRTLLPSFAGSTQVKEPIMAFATLHDAPAYGLSRHLQAIHKFPLLAPQEEVALARRWREGQDIEAAHKLVTSHLRLVAKIAMGYRGYGLPVGELISEGNIGLMQAVKRFDPDRGFRLATYAMWWIRAAMQEYILHSWSLVKMGTTAAQKKLFFNLRRLKGRMQAIDDGDLQPEQVAKIARVLDVPEPDVISMNRRLAAPDHSLNTSVREDSGAEWQDSLVDESETQENALAEREEFSGRKALLPNALMTLNDRERHILVERRLKDNPTTLETLSQQYGVSRERVRQIEERAFEKLRKAMKARMIENSLKHNRAAVTDHASAHSG
jgi:RNA polymerase sigma-32 factor